MATRTIILLLLWLIPSIAICGANKEVTAFGASSLLLQSGGKVNRMTFTSAGVINIPGLTADSLPYVDASKNFVSDAGLTFDGSTLVFPLATNNLMIGTAGAAAAGLLADANVDASAAIARTKLASGTNNHVLINNGSGVMSSEALLGKTRGGTGITSTATFPASGTVATLAATEVFTNKEYDGGTASDTSRIKLPTETTANLAGLTDFAGLIGYDSTLGAVVFNTGAGWNKIDSAAGLTHVVKSSSVTLADSGEDIISADASGGAITLTLPPCSTNDSLKYKLSKIDTSDNGVTLDGDSTDTIGGETTVEMYGETTSIEIVCNGGTDWIITKEITPTVCILSNKETSGTSGGNATANTVQVRDIETLDEGSGPGSCGFASVASEQVTLQIGTYEHFACAPGYKVSRHQLFLHDGSSYVADGRATYTGSGDDTHTHACLNVTLKITSATTYEIRHWTSGTQAGNGLGVNSDSDASNPQTTEIYTQDVIRKIR